MDDGLPFLKASWPAPQGAVFFALPAFYFCSWTEKKKKNEELGPIAQLVSERRLCKAEVESSNLSGSTPSNGVIGKLDLPPPVRGKVEISFISSLKRRREKGKKGTALREVPENIALWAITLPHTALTSSRGLCPRLRRACMRGCSTRCHSHFKKWIECRDR